MYIYCLECEFTTLGCLIRGLFFYISRMTYLDSNIPSEMFYPSTGSEILHTSRTTTDMVDMVRCVNIL